MTEYQLLDLMYQGFIQNAMYFVGMVLLTWLGFRMAANVASDPNMAGQIFTTIFCLFVGLFWYTTNQIGGGVLNSYTAQLMKWELTQELDLVKLQIHQQHLVELCKLLLIFLLLYFN